MYERFNVIHKRGYCLHDHIWGTRKLCKCYLSLSEFGSILCNIRHLSHADWHAYGYGSLNSANLADQNWLSRFASGTNDCWSLFILETI